MIRCSEIDLTDAEVAAAGRVIRSGRLTQGPTVAEFERRFARMTWAEHCIACNSGTAALHLALKASGVGRGSRVAVPDLTYIATANAVAYCGGSVVPMNVDPASWLLEGNLVRGVDHAVLVHLY